MFGKKDHCRVCCCSHTSRNNAGNTEQDVGVCDISISEGEGVPWRLAQQSW